MGGPWVGWSSSVLQALSPPLLLSPELVLTSLGGTVGLAGTRDGTMRGAL